MKGVLYEIGPLLETNWTGIPVFAARLARLLIDDPQLEPTFFWREGLVPTDLVVDALRLGTGLYLRGWLERNHSLSFPKEGITPTVALYPSVKPLFGIAPREASVVHDLSTVITPEFHTTENIRHHRSTLEQELSTNEITFAVSKATAEDLSYYCGLHPDSVRVAYQFAEWPREFNTEVRNLVSGRTAEPYVVVLGTIEPRKNLRLIFSALDALFDLDPRLKIVVIGKRGWKVEEALGAKIQRWIERGQLQFTGFVSEYEKFCLLRLCQFLVFPSMFEGFGIPVLESMLVGRPVLASFSSSIPEVAGDAAVYFDPLSTADFLQKFAYMRDNVREHETSIVETCRQAAAQFGPQRFLTPFKEWITAE